MSQGWGGAVMLSLGEACSLNTIWSGITVYIHPNNGLTISDEAPPKVISGRGGLATLSFGNIRQGVYVPGLGGAP